MALFNFSIATDTTDLPFDFVFTQDMTTFMNWNFGGNSVAWFSAPALPLTGFVDANDPNLLSEITGGKLDMIEIGIPFGAQWTFQAQHLDIDTVGFFAALKTGDMVIAGRILTAGDDTMEGSAFNDWLRGGDGLDRIGGGDGKDHLFGDGGNDWLFGEFGNDKLAGGGGADTLIGDLGNDTLTGNGGVDTFAFSAFSNVSGATDHSLDLITDFQSGVDHFQINFSGFASGALSAAQFHLGTTVVGKQSQILFDPATGIVSWDADGTGHKAAVAFAQVTLGLVLHETDFLIG